MSRALRLKAVVTLLSLQVAISASAQPWFHVPSPNLDSLNNRSIGIGGTSSGDVWVVGTYENYDSATSTAQWENMILHWNSTTWTQHPYTIPGVNTEETLMDIVAPATNQVWAGGLLNVGSDIKPQLVRWNGTSWSPQAVPTICDNGAIYTMKAFSASDIWAAGDLYNDTSDSTYLLHYTGTAWSPIPVLPQGTVFCTIQDIEGAGSNDLWVVGSKMPLAPGNSALIMHYDGTNWTEVPIPNALFPGAGTARQVRTVGTNGILVSVDVFPGPTSILYYDGSAWSLLTDPPAPTLAPVMLDTNRIFNWGTAGIHYYNGAVWSLGQPLAQQGYPDLAGNTVLPDGSVWVTGNNYISPSKSGTLVYRTNPTTGVSAVPGHSASLQASPNPSGETFRITMSAEEGTPVQARVYDGSGRLVSHQTIQTRKDRATFDINLKGQPNGIYFLRAGESSLRLIKR